MKVERKGVNLYILVENVYYLDRKIKQEGIMQNGSFCFRVVLIFFLVV